MAEIPSIHENFIGGIASFDHQGPLNSFAFARSVDVRTDPKSFTVLPRTIKESGNTVTDLVKWGEIYQPTLDLYEYGDVGNLYKRTSAQVYTFLRTIPNSHGNGLSYNPEDDYLYYTGDKVIGRYGPLSSSSPTFTDDFLGAQGGIPLNTSSLDLEASSSQYASRADTASLSITGNIAISAQIKPESLPSVGGQYVIFSKWDESGTTRSYKFDLNVASGYFGDGSDGAITISVSASEVPIDSGATATSGTTSVAATNVSFATGQVILVYQAQGANAGQWERNSILGYTAGTITTSSALLGSYTTGAQVRVLKQYTDVTVNSGITYSAKAWNGTSGGVLSFIASGTVTGVSTGSFSAQGKGFRGGTSVASNTKGYQGESYSGTGSQSYSPNNSGGGGGDYSGNNQRSGGGGAGHATTGNDGGNAGGGSPLVGFKGLVATDTTDLTNAQLGSGGGGGSGEGGTSGGTAGGNGGGWIFIIGTTITNSAFINADGDPGVDGSDQGAGGGGAGGSVLIKCQTGTLGAGLITALGGVGGNGSGAADGGAGGVGRIAINYYTSFTGNSTPAEYSLQDNSLVTNTTTQLRLSVSANGNTGETLAMATPVSVATWQQVGVSWVAATSIATFFVNGAPVGTRTGTITAIHDNASRPALGISYDGAGAAANFYDGLIDEVQIYNTTRSASDFLYSSTQQIPVNTTGLVAYYQLNGDYVDAVAGALNTLTATNAPIFTTDVPFSSPTTRLDIDQFDVTATGDTYALKTAISEASADKLLFTPAKDPQKSIAFNIAAVGTGNWTVIIHDSNNNVMDTVTVTNANLHTGIYEFVFPQVWRPLTNFTNIYHAHVISTVADGTIVSTSNNDLDTAYFVTYYQFMVEQSAWHPIAQFLNFKVIGNERYVATYEAPLYDPHRLILEPGWSVRCFGYWGEYLAIGMTYGTSVEANERGKIWFWDGVSDFANYSIEIPEGGINAMFGSRGELFFFAGYQGDFMVYSGGLTARVLHRMPNIQPTEYMEIFPGAMTMWKKLLRFGSAGVTNSTNIQQGGYTWGSTNVDYPDILTYDYPLSTGTLIGSGVKVGMMTVVNQKLIMSWKDGTNYGVDYVDASNAPFPTATIEFLWDDLLETYKEKSLLQIASKFTPLQTGEGISLKYRLDDATSWTPNPDSPSVDDTLSRFIAGGVRYNQMQTAMDITVSGTTAPTIKSVVSLVDNLPDENVLA